MRTRFSKVVIKKPYERYYVSFKAFFIDKIAKRFHVTSRFAVLSRQFSQPQMSVFLGKRAKGRSGICVFPAILLALVFLLPYQGQAQDDPEEILNAITKIRATIPGDARTAGSLGTEREGNGVVIDSEGHVLTIGYLILEAETIRTNQGRPG